MIQKQKGEGKFSIPRRRGAYGAGVIDAIAWAGVTLVIGWLLFSLLGGWHLIGHHSSRHHARRINCAGNLKQIGLALIIYAGDDVERGLLPDGPQFGALNNHQYLVDGKVYGCPSSANPGSTAANSSYVYLGQGLSDMHPQAQRVIVAHDRLDNHDKGWINCLYLDGHVKGYKSRAESWQEFRAEREAAGDLILNEPEELRGKLALPTYQVLD